MEFNTFSAPNAYDIRYLIPALAHILIWQPHDPGGIFKLISAGTIMQLAATTDNEEFKKHLHNEAAKLFAPITRSEAAAK